MNDQTDSLDETSAKLPGTALLDDDARRFLSDLRTRQAAEDARDRPRAAPIAYESLHTMNATVSEDPRISVHAVFTPWGELQEATLHVGEEDTAGTPVRRDSALWRTVYDWKDAWAELAQEGFIDEVADALFRAAAERYVAQETDEADATTHDPADGLYSDADGL